MPMGLPAYDCDPNTAICGGGFGGANDIRSRVGAGQSGAPGYAWGVYNVPLFEGYDPRLREPVTEVGGQRSEVSEPQQAQTTQATGNQQPQSAGSSQQTAGSNLLVPALIIIAALAFGK